MIEAIFYYKCTMKLLLGYVGKAQHLATTNGNLLIAYSELVS